MPNIDINISFDYSLGTRGQNNSEFVYPSGLCILNNEMYVVDKQNNRVQVFDLAGIYQRQFGTVGSGNNNFFFPEGIDTDGTNLYVVDSGNHRIKKHQPDGTYLLEFGTEGTGTSNFKYPVGIDVMSSMIIVADKQNHRIKIHDLSGVFILEFGSYGSGNSEFNFPEGVTYFDNKIYVADSGNGKVKVFNAAGLYISDINAKTFNYPVGLINVEDKLIGVVDRVDSEITFLDTVGQVVSEYGSEGVGINEYSFPGNGYFSDDILYTTDSANHRVKVLNAVLEDNVPIYVNELMNLTKQLYPTGRAWWLNYQNTFSLLHEALAYSESRALENSVGILNSILPDNDLFSEQDAFYWENALGLILSSSLTLEERKANILRKMQHPGNIPARQHYLYLQGQLQDAGFSVYVFENRVPIGGGNYEVINPIPALYGAFDYNSSTYGSVGIPGIDVDSVIANYIDENKDSTYNFGNDVNLRATFFIGDVTFGQKADVPIDRKEEFRELILKIKPAQTAGWLLINYV